MVELKDLVELLEESRKKSANRLKERGETKDHFDVRNFIEEMNVVGGNDKVPNYIIFYIYRKIYKPKTHDRANKIVFFRTFNKFFNSYRTKKQRYYLLNKDKLNITREVEIEAGIYDEKYKEQVKKRKNKASKSKKKHEPKS